MWKHNKPVRLTRAQKEWLIDLVDMWREGQETYLDMPPEDEDEMASDMNLRSAREVAEEEIGRCREVYQCLVR